MCLVGSLRCCQGLCRSFCRAGTENLEVLEGETVYKLVKVFSAGETFSWLDHLPAEAITQYSCLLIAARGCLLQASKQLNVRIQSVLLKLGILCCKLVWCNFCTACSSSMLSSLPSFAH